MSHQDRQQTNNNKRSAAGAVPSSTTDGYASAFPGTGMPVGGAAYGYGHGQQRQQSGYGHLPPPPPAAAYNRMPPLPPPVPFRPSLMGQSNSAGSGVAAPASAAGGGNSDGDEVLVLDGDDDPPLKSASAAAVSDIDLGEDDDSDDDSEDGLTNKEFIAQNTSKGKTAKKKEQKAKKKAAQKKAAAKPSGAMFGTGSGSTVQDGIIKTGNVPDGFFVRSSNGATGKTTFPNLALTNNRSTVIMIALSRIVIKYGGHTIAGKMTNSAGESVGFVWGKIFNEFYAGPGRLIKPQTGKDPVKQFRAVVVGAVGRRYGNINWAGHSTSTDPGTKEDLTPVDKLVKTIHESIENATSGTVMDEGDDLSRAAEKARTKNRISGHSDKLTAVGLGSAPILDLASAPGLASTAGSKAAKTSALSKSRGNGGGKKRGAGESARKIGAVIGGAKRSKKSAGGEEDPISVDTDSDDEKKTPTTMAAMMAKMMETKGGGGGIDVTGLLAEKKIDREEREKREAAKSKAKDDRAKDKHKISERKMDLAERKEERKKKSSDMKNAIKMRESIKKEKMEWYAMHSEGKITEVQLNMEIAQLNAKLEKLDD